MFSKKPIKLFVPRYGTLLQLVKDWTFPLHHEGRNEKLLEAVGQPFNRRLWGNDVPKPVMVTLPKGTELKVDRLYIRNDGGKASDFDSITFQITSCPQEGLSKKHGFGKTRFWVKMNDANGMEAVVDDERRVAEHKVNPAVTADLQVGDVVTRDYWAMKEGEEKGEWFITRKLADNRLLILGKSGANYIALNLSDYSNNFMTLMPKPVYVVKKHEDDLRAALLKWVKFQAKNYNWSLFKGSAEKQMEDWVDQTLKAPAMSDQALYRHASSLKR